MKESVEKRISLIKEYEDYDELKKHLCPFFESGGCPECRACKKTEADLDECRDVYLEKIYSSPLDVWDDTFESVKVISRDTVSLENIVGIGINCDACYMYEKCPLFKRGYACGIKWDDNKPSTPVEFMDFLIGTQFDRVKRASVFEKIDGGVPEAGLSGEMDRLHNLVASKIDMGRERFSLSVEATGSAKPEGGGILSRLFGGASLPKEEKLIEIPEKPESRSDIIDVTAIEEATEITKAVKVARKRKED